MKKRALALFMVLCVALTTAGHRQQKVKIFWNFLDEIDIPDIEGTVVYQRPLKTQKTA